VATRISVILSCDGSEARRTAFSMVPVTDIVFLTRLGRVTGENPFWDAWGKRMEGVWRFRYGTFTRGGWRGLAKAGRR
jgi:hypothetical protein